MQIVQQHIQDHREEFLAAYRELRPIGRFEIEVRLDWRCNAKCKFCGVWKYSRDGMLPVSRWQELFDELAGLGLAHVLFTGGEPMLYPDFLPIIEHVDSLGVHTAIITNGSLLDEERVRRLAALKGLEQITVSLDSADPAVHDEVRKMRGLFRRATKGMARLRELAPHIRLVVNTVVSASTAATVKDLLTLPVTPDHLRVFPVGLDMAWLDSLSGVAENDWGPWADEAKTERLTDEAVAEVRGHLRELAERAAEAGVSVELDRLHHDGPFTGDCVVPMGHFVIQPDGDVYPCCHVQDEPNRIGRLATQSVAEMLAGDAYRSCLANLRPATLPACRSCSRYRSFNEEAGRLTMIGMPSVAGGPA
ncbi:radical SAM protein [Kutzneria kofuensis]|uniref:Radical SAM protein with 4Fe4S-binding SPASM domain n=1 Tax=Kutzneria kofuensis TaxID=103725 RepID=A0A7W9KSV5_9PSEU|nr:radical SAM protein [Kutzneria kofuensis]MBB5898125.1 radical SAM protein with 4Fe4S-binding SPASM domain [Kutzneria kofuensis]